MKVSDKQFLQLYRSAPQELKEAMEADRTIDTIERVSAQEELNDKEHSALVSLMGEVLVGLLAPSKFKEALIKDGRIEEKSAERISQIMNRFVFSRVKDTLENLYQEKVEAEKDEAGKNGAEEKAVKKTPKGKDQYREPIEE